MNIKIRNSHYSRRFRQAGVTLLELVLVIGLLSTMAVGEIEEAQRVLSQQRAAQMANELLSYNNGVRSHIGNFGGQYQADPAPAEISGVRDGVSWLKSSTTCAAGGGTNVDNFVPCEFLNANGGNLSFSGMTFRTFFSPTFDAAAGRGSVTAFTVISSPAGGTWQINGEEASALSGLSALLVSGANKVGSNPLGFATDMQAVYCISNATVPSVCASPAIPAGFTTGKIVLVASNSANSDAWLRIDGSNEMQNDLSFNDAQPATSREILNVARLLGRATEGIILGDAGVFGGASAPDNMIIVDANKEIFGTLLVRGNTTVQDASLIVNNGMIAVTGGDITTDRDVRSREVFASRFIDADDNVFFADPNATSMMAGIRSFVLANINPGGELAISTNSGFGGAGNPDGGNITLDSNVDLQLRADRNTTSNSAVDFGIYAGRDGVLSATNNLALGAANGNLTGQGSSVFFQNNAAGASLTLDSASTASLYGNVTQVGSNSNTAITSNLDVNVVAQQDSLVRGERNTNIQSGNDVNVLAGRQVDVSSAFRTYINGGNQMGLEVNDSYTALGNFNRPTYIRSHISNIHVQTNGVWASLNDLIPSYIHKNTFVQFIGHGQRVQVPRPFCIPPLQSKILAYPAGFSLGSIFEATNYTAVGHLTIWANPNGGVYDVFLANQVPNHVGGGSGDAARIRTGAVTVINTYCSRI